VTPEVSYILDMLKSFLINQDSADLDNWHCLDCYTKKMFDWLPALKNKLGKTYCYFNLAWPAKTLISESPEGYDTYVINFQFEYADFDWIRDFCLKVYPSKVLLITPYSTCKYQCQNLQLLQYEGWPIVLDWYQSEYGWPDVTFDSKTKKLSLLAHRISQFRTYVCAYVYQTWHQQDYLMSWHGKLGKPEDLYLLNHTGNSKIDAVIDFIKKMSFLHMQIKPEQQFHNTALANLDYAWSAYADCLINSSNESVNNSFQFINDKEYIMPGPYLTEKTMKCLLSRTALLPAGQYSTYAHLQSLGFEFDYPWDKSFDDTFQDISRFEKFFNTLDQINKLDFDYIKQKIKHSCDHNREHIISGDFLSLTSAKNAYNIDQFYRS
jgi:hypothetical protein